MADSREIEKPSIPSMDEPRWQLAGRVLLWMHLGLAGVWWWMMPGGFPVAHPRFWVNQVLPWLLLLTATVGLYANRKQIWWAYHAVLAGLAAMWTSALVIGVTLFPISAPRFFAIPLALVLLLLGSCAITIRMRWLGKRSTMVIVATFLAIGVALPYSQRASQPETHPLGSAMPVIETPDAITTVPALIKLGQGVVVSRFAGSVEARYGRLSLLINPLLTFQSRSPDRCWTIFAPPHNGKYLQIPMVATVDDSNCHIAYAGQESHFLEVRAEEASGSLMIETYSQLEEPVYSHLNSFCELMIIGHRRLSVTFSPCPEAQIEFQPAEYPTGAPIHAAYVDHDRNFHIVSARSGEKGPFEVLASGHLTRDQPLTLTFFDGQKAIFRVELSDWASQASVALSPTAGWGFPEGAIEFRLSGDSLDSPAMVWFTLSGTSVGRGVDSVGHAAGVYRNRLRVISLEGKDETSESADLPHH